MKIAITGSTGLVGGELVKYFTSKGHSVSRFARPSTNRDGFKEDLIEMDVTKGFIDLVKLDGHDVVINLAGANIAGQRWTPSYKDEILKSRTCVTTILSEGISRLDKPPKVFLSASAIGYYGPHSADCNVTESDEAGSDFLADVCNQWEKATESAQKAGVRTILMRIGAVLSSKGGALSKMLPVFKLGGGGYLGNGRQMFSWIALDELPRVMNFLIESHWVSGPVNLVSPNPMTNAEFTKAMGKALNRPTVLPLPSFMAKLMFGEMADSLLLNGAKVLPKKLLDNGYGFQYPDIASALKVSLV